jgi:signal transduction histidine kinase
MNLRSININRALKSLCEQFSYKERAQKVNLALKASLKNAESEIMTDGTKLVQILSNLINNALKFTPEGSIDIGYKLKDGFLEFFVKDTGIGIPPEFHSKVFERFYQVDNTVSRQYQGTGLGLSICKAYAELLGGKIWLESQPGNGTTFIFTIPYVKSESVNAE